VVNLFYIGLVSWNTFILIARSRAWH
jgi:hypothetical protein